MRSLTATLKEHLSFLIVATLLTLAMTFPTILYVFRTDVYALPTGGSADVYVELWNAWYGKQILAGKADRFYTDLIFYPAGVSLARQPMFIQYAILMGALQLLLPLSNAFCMALLINVFTCALAAYAYFVWLFKDKWIALFGAVVFGFSPFVIGHPHWPDIGWIAPLPLAVYFFHRGVLEARMVLVGLAGFLVGLILDASYYLYVVAVIALGMVIVGLAVSRWRDRAYWRLVALLILAVSLSSAWGVLPLLNDSGSLAEPSRYYPQEIASYDFISFFLNPNNPILGPLADRLIAAPDRVSVSNRSYLGVVPLILVAAGLYSRRSRRRMIPWMGMCLAFVVLHLGPALEVNGAEFLGLKLPMHYLRQLLPIPFKAFYFLYFFMPGVYLSLAALACYGLIALRERCSIAARPGFIMLLIAIVASEYYIPIEMTSVDPIARHPIQERIAFIDWLAEEPNDDIKIINLPFELRNSMLYLFYQSLSGYPQATGGISRPPDSAFDYLRANPVTRTWLEQRSTNCVLQGPTDYLAGVTQLIEDGFSHVIYHRGFYYWTNQDETFRYVDPAYSDDYVSIYRLTDMLESCVDCAATGSYPSC